ncbi:hypothetical protein, partial [Actinophytocola sp.]|uniref:hypothetical protein n=1 Tax=Actinophytocola sp. TaxID=1872138 RepID=UPI0025BC67A8
MHVVLVGRPGRERLAMIQIALRGGPDTTRPRTSRHGGLDVIAQRRGRGVAATPHIQHPAGRGFGQDPPPRRIRPVSEINRLLGGDVAVPDQVSGGVVHPERGAGGQGDLHYHLGVFEVLTGQQVQ